MGCRLSVRSLSREGPGHRTLYERHWLDPSGADDWFEAFQSLVSRRYGLPYRLGDLAAREPLWIKRTPGR